MFAKMGSDIIQGTSVELSNGKGDSNILKPHQNNFMGYTADGKMYASSDKKIKYQSNGENLVTHQLVMNSAGPTKGPVKASSIALDLSNGKAADNTFKQFNQIASDKKIQDIKKHL